MICTNCNTQNGADCVYCVNCGSTLPAETMSAMPTVPFTVVNPSVSEGYSLADSTETAVVNLGQPQAAIPPTAPAIFYQPEPQVKKSSPLIWVAVGLVAVLAIAAAGIILIVPRIGGGEVLPDHLGMFDQSLEKDRVDEIQKQDFSSAVDAKNALIKNDALRALDPQPNLILYAEGNDVPVNDLRLIQLDSIKDDGTMKQLDFQVAPVDGKPAMKRVRVPAALANGKYAFALIDGYFNEGNHKFWAFQVKTSPTSDNGDALKASSAALKPAPPKQQTVATIPGVAVPPPVAPAAPPPAGASVATVSTRLKLRSSPTQFGNNQIGSLNRGTTVYVLEYSANSETFQGLVSRYAYVQTPGGLRGWAFAAYLR